MSFIQSKYVQINETGHLIYTHSAEGDRIPDFSHVGYHHGNQPLPNADSVSMETIRVLPNPRGDSLALIQEAVNLIAERPFDGEGYRGVIQLGAGVYHISETINIHASGIILRGEGNDTILRATGKAKRPLIYAGLGFDVDGDDDEDQPKPDQKCNKKQFKGVKRSRLPIVDDYVPVGRTTFTINDNNTYRVGDRIVVIREPNDAWIHDIRMHDIKSPDGRSISQWQPKRYFTKFERVIINLEHIHDPRRPHLMQVTIDNPIVNALDKRYDESFIMHYTHDRITHVGIEKLQCLSDYTSEDDEEHATFAVIFNHIEDAWMRGVHAKYFIQGCCNIAVGAKNITVKQCSMKEAKSIITGGRRYSFSIDGQQSIVMDCHAADGRHDYVTGGTVAGPNVFYNCTAIHPSNMNSDIGPHMRWSTGILYDNITTDGTINVQDRGGLGSGQGWAGANHVVWRCTAKNIVCQNLWVPSTGRNYCVGCVATKHAGHFDGRPDGEWDCHNEDRLAIPSIYRAQLHDPTRLVV